MKINAYVKNRGSSVTSKPLPSSPPLQRGRGLANHPLSCHPQRSVCQSRKGKENERKWEKGGSNGETTAPFYCRRPVQFIQTEAYISAQCM